MATPSKEKTMSSRLLTMKFMQRSAASAATGPGSAPKSAPSTPDSRPSKRPRLSEPLSRPADTSSRGERARVAEDRRTTDLEQVQAALAAEEAKRQEALDRTAADAGDTKWHLDLPKGYEHLANGQGFQVVSAGWSAIDGRGRAIGTQEENEDEEVAEETSRRRESGRRSFGRFNRTIEKAQDPSGYQSSSSDSDDSEDEEPGSEDGEIEDAEAGMRSGSSLSKRKSSAAADELREKRKAKRKAEKQDLAQQAERRRNKQVKLNTLTSISGTGGARSGQSNKSKEPQPCWGCGSTDHKKNECPRRTLGR